MKKSEIFCLIIVTPFLLSVIIRCFMIGRFVEPIIILTTILILALLQIKELKTKKNTRTYLMAIVERKNTMTQEIQKFKILGYTNKLDIKKELEEFDIQKTTVFQTFKENSSKDKELIDEIKKELENMLNLETFFLALPIK